MRKGLIQEREWARGWLLNDALPLWWWTGADHAGGGFHDKLDQAGEPVALPKRIRVQARQIFVYAAAKRLGWSGPCDAAVAHGLDFMRGAYRRSDGLYRASVDRDGRPVVEEPDLYDQAFVLFALASGYEAQGRPAALLSDAEYLLATLGRLLAHQERGFEEARPRRLPLRSNPHMHMLEALLAWVELGVAGPFEAKAREIVALATERMIDPATGAVGEYFDGGWMFAARPEGGIREPGHQFEWAYLLDLAGRLLGEDHQEAVRKLAAFGSAYGLGNEGRVLFSVDASGAVIDASSRLWAQTERLRAMIVLPEDIVSNGKESAVESVVTLRRFLDVPVPGLWRDRTDDAGLLLHEPAPASSLYHIVTGLEPLIRG